MARSTGKRPNGEGALYFETSRGAWVGDIIIEGRRYRVFGKDKTAASGKLRRLLQDIDSGTLSTDRNLTIEEATSRFLSRTVPGRRGGTLAPSTRAVHEWAGRLIIAGLGRRKVSTLTTQHVEAFLDRLAFPEGQPSNVGGHSADLPSEALSRASIVKVRSTLRLILTECMKRREVSQNVAAIVELPGDLPPAGTRRVLTPTESRQLLAHLPNETNGAMYALCLCAGLRPGEAAGLYWSSIKGDRVTISRAVRLNRGRAMLVDTLKTASSNRTVRIPAELVTMLAGHKRQQAEARLAAKRWHNPDLVFTSPTGNVLSPPNVRKHLADVCERAGVPVIRPNELRHSCASYLSDLGHRHEDIADLLGHTTTRMVDRTYRHRLRSSVDIAAEVSWLAEGRT